MNRRIRKKVLTGMLCVVLLLTNIISIGIEVFAIELDSFVSDIEEELNEDNNGDMGEITEREGQEEDTALGDIGNNEFQNNDDNKEASDSENEGVESRENEDINNLEEESGEIENDVNEILEENKETNEEAETITFSVEGVEMSGQCGDNLTWSLEDGTLTISGTGSMWNFSSENPPWKEYINDLKKLIIEDGVCTIGDNAFKDCSSFSGDLVIPNSVTEIGTCAFKNCNGFTGRLILPENITEIRTGTFFGCSGFTGSLIIPNGVKIISHHYYDREDSRDGAFEECDGLDGEIVLPDSITEIGDHAFKNCSGLTGKLVIKSNVKTIGEESFGGCTKINKICFGGNAPTIMEKVVINNDIYYYGSFNGIISDVYYPNSAEGWEDIIVRDKKFGYSGTSTWIPYTEGTRPWESESAEGTTNFWITAITDTSDLAYYDGSGYNKRQFSLDISLTHLGMGIDPESYEDVNLTVELSEGLSFSQDEEIRTISNNLGTIDKANNKQDVSHLVYCYSAP